jgi:hypothetical protein
LSAQQDLENVLKRGHQFDSAAHAHAQYLWRTQQFLDWLRGNNSAVLLVDGSLDGMSAGRISPMSLFCATLAVQLPETRRNIWLQFFCGPHTRTGDALYGPQGMLRSILTQLLLNLYQRSMMTLTLPDPSALLGCGAEMPLDCLCRIFHDLVRGLPRGLTVFCALDGINYFETPPMAQPLCDAVSFLQNTASDSSTGAHFKLLLTSGSKSKHVCGLVHQNWQRLTLHRGQGNQAMSQRAIMNEANRFTWGS